MDNQNYLISSRDEQIAFERMLTEKEIPFERLSPSSFAVESAWSEEADTIFQMLGE